MREKIKDKGRLEHILNSIDVLLCNKGKYEYADVEKDPIVFFGFVKHVEIIGEAVYSLPQQLFIHLHSNCSKLDKKGYIIKSWIL